MDRFSQILKNGILGDKRGRLSVLFGSILVYSLANIANSWVHSVDAYAVLRFISGFGLAGELGAAITLVSEVLSTRSRGYATGLIAACGALGVVAAAIVGELLPRRLAYIVGGSMGLVLLILRFKTLDSSIFAKMAKDHLIIRRGDLRMLLQPRRFRLFLSCVLAGAPLWLMSGILATFATELTMARGALGEVKTSMAILACNLGMICGDLASSFLSQILRSRRKVIIGAVLTTAFLVSCFLALKNAEPLSYYLVLAAIGFSVGNWAVLLMASAEQFGTNLRATVTTSVPNFVRVLLVPMSLGLEFLRPELGLWQATNIVAAVVLILALFGALSLRETFDRELDFVEVDAS